MARKKLTHVGPDGSARMVDVGAKPATHRVAVAEAAVDMKPATASAIRSGRAPKGAVLEVARVAGINAAKLTSALIPMCHPLALTKVGIEFSWKGKALLRIEARVEAVDRTGVEMEALTAAATAALTIYDMVKAAERGVEIRAVRLEEKQGGRSGHWRRGRQGRTTD
jgi:cyclic pyranopterin phosphate synthase